MHALAYGRISVANDPARALGVEPGQSVETAIDHREDAATPTGRLEAPQEARRRVALEGSGAQVWLLDSASLVSQEDRGEIIVTGSHGGVVGGDPSRALKTGARVAVFNDAGVGIDDAGVARLPLLERLGTAAVTVDCMTARIGNAVSALETGVISRGNAAARALGARKGQALKAWLAHL